MITGPAVDRHGALAVTSQPATLTAAVTHHRPTAGYGELPMRFEPNVGQAPAPVKYLSQAQDYSVALTAGEAIIGLRRGAAVPAFLRLSLVHANTNPQLRAERLQPSVSNYFVGNDRAKWHGNVANYAAVRYQQVYPGIDWVVYGNPQRLEYDLILAPQADPGPIKLEITGADLSLSDDGDLLIKVGDETLRQLKPVVYQSAADGEQRRVPGHYALDHRQISFVLGPYDHDRQLIIDPTFVYSTYLGGTGGDEGNAIAVDSAGNAYVAGSTSSSDFPTAGAIQSARGGVSGANAFVTKFNADGSGLVYSTYLGGSGFDTAVGIAVDSSGSAYVTGSTTSTDFPTLNPFQATNHAANPGVSNAFITKLNAAGTALEYSTYLGGSGASDSAESDSAAAIAVDSSGNAYVAGRTNSKDFPTLNPFQAMNKNGGSVAGSNAFITKLNAAGSALIYSTYLGGSFSDAALGIAVDGAGDVYVVGQTGSTDFPTLNPFQATNNAASPVNYLGHDFTAFLTKFNAAGTALVYSTYLGGSGSDGASGIAVDSAGSAYVAGATSSTDFPTLGSFQAVNHAAGTGATNVFVTKFNADGSALVYSTYIGGSGNDRANGIAVDGTGNVSVVGTTQSTDFPTVEPIQSTNNGVKFGTSVAFISQLKATGDALTFSTYLGGSGDEYVFTPTALAEALGDEGNAVAVDTAGNIYVVGTAGSGDFPTSNPYQKTNLAYSTSHYSNAFVARITLGPVPTATGSYVTANSGGGGALGWGLIGVLGLVVVFRNYGDRPCQPL